MVRDSLKVLKLIVDSGLLPLVIAFLGAIVSILGVYLTSWLTIRRVRLEAALDRQERMEQERIKFMLIQLSEFYDPIFSLLSVNQQIFGSIGPNSSLRRDETFPEEEAPALWNELVDTVITPNNSRICNLIETKLHLMSIEDNIYPYLEFATHAHAYEVFRRNPYEAYSLFQFPEDFAKHVEIQRSKVRSKIAELMKDRTA